MSVEKRKTKFGSTVYSIRYRDGSGRYLRETLGTEAAGWTAAKARAVERKRRAQIEAGFRAPRHLSFGHVAGDWLDETALRRAWKPRTLLAYRGSVERFDGLLQEKISRIRSADIEAWVTSSLKKYSHKTVNDTLTVMQQVFDYAIRCEFVQTNPVSKVSRPKVSKQTWRILTPAEIQKVVPNFVDDSFRLMFRTLALTALRRGELLNLQWVDIDFERGLLRVQDSKTDHGLRAVALPGGLAADLREQRRKAQNFAETLCPDEVLDETWPIFYPDKTRRWVEHHYTLAFRAALKASGIDAHVRPFHDMRHTSLTNSAALGAEPMALMTKAGHGSFDTTRQYLQLAGIVFPDEAKRLEERLDNA